MNMKAITHGILVFSAMLANTQAASIAISVAQSNSGAEGSTAINLTTEGTSDWAIWQNTGRTPTNSMNGGSGFTSMSLIAGAADTGATFGNPENAYSWTNGTPTTTGTSITQAARAVLANNGDGVKLTIDVSAANSYQLKFYTTTFNVNLDASVSLSTGAVSDTAPGTLDGGLDKYEYTVDFTTDGADTLTLDILKNGGTSSTLAFESFTLKTISTVPNLAINSNATYSNNGVQESFQLPYSNSGPTNPLTVTSVTPGGTDASFFTIDTFTTPVASGGNGAIEFTFNPTDGNRIYNATFTILSNDPDSPSTVVDVVVTATAIHLGNILCIGDSITEATATRPANDGGWSWRYPFWKHLVDSAVSHEFVGTRTANHGGTSVYPDYNGQSFLNRHEAIWGRTARERANSAPTYLAALKSQGKIPDTAIIYCGGNDIPTNLSVSAATVRDRIQTIINHLQGDLGTSGNPSIRILLVSIIPRFTGFSKTTPDVRNMTRFTEINNLLKPLASAETTSTSKVSFLNIFPLFNTPPGLLWDGVHPNGAGEQIEADQIFSALVPDSDTDGIHDSWELVYFPDLVTANPSSDDDGDGIHNLDEFTLGSSPIVNNQALQIFISPDNTQLSFTLPAAEGIGYEGLTRKYTLESSTDLDDWDTEQEGTTDGNTVNFQLPNTNTRVFYRLRVQLE